MPNTPPRRPYALVPPRNAAAAAVPSRVNPSSGTTARTRIAMISPAPAASSIEPTSAAAAVSAARLPRPAAASPAGR